MRFNKNTFIYVLSLLLLITNKYVRAQSAIGVNTTTPDASAALEVSATDKGLLIPRMTLSQRGAIASPANGLLVYQTDGTEPGFYYYNSPSWVLLTTHGIPPAGNTNQVLTKADNSDYSAYWSNVIAGSGSNNYIPKFTSSLTLGNSLIQDNGTSLAVNFPPQTLSQLYVYRLQLTATGDGQSSLMGYRNRNTQNDGINYGQSGCNVGVMGHSFWGDQYSFGVGGWNYNDFTRTGGVIGSEISGAYWGTLGYKNSGGVLTGVYGSGAYNSGTGYLPKESKVGVGGAFYGGVMGAWAKGDVLGFTSTGELYASYNLGNEYTSGHQADIITNNGIKSVAYSNTSTQLKIYEDGYSKMDSSTTFIAYSEKFKLLKADAQRPVITVTAIGKPVGLYIKSITPDGFWVSTIDANLSNVEFSWTVMANRIDNAETAVPAAVLDAEFDSNLQQVLFNENNKEQSAKPIWWDGNKLRYDTPPNYNARQATETGE